MGFEIDGLHIFLMFSLVVAIVIAIESLERHRSIRDKLEALTQDKKKSNLLIRNRIKDYGNHWQ